jgi:glycosyltransferase involved in cell wall biosynthesis
MRILHLISSIGFFGAENVVVGLCKGLRDLDCNPFVGVMATPQSSHMHVVRAAEQEGLGTKTFDCSGKLDVRTILEIRSYLIERKISILHCHGYKSNFYGLLAASNSRVKKVTTCHNWLGGGIKMSLYEYLDKLLLNAFDKIVVVTEALKDDVLRYVVGKEKVLVINNGVDGHRFSPSRSEDSVKRRLGIEGNEKVIGTVGRLSPEKGHVYLLKAFEKIVLKVPDARLVIVGTGPLRQDLESKVKALGLDERVLFLGARKDVPQLLNAMDVFVLPSIFEGMPVALLEAMACARPIVATDVGSIPRLIQDQRTGLLVKAKDVRGLVAAIMSFLKEPSRGEMIGMRARDLVIKEFSLEKTSARYLGLYQRLLAERKKREGYSAGCAA